MRLISWRRSFVELVAMLCIAGLCGAAGHSNRGFAEPQGGGRKAELSLSELSRPNGPVGALFLEATQLKTVPTAIVVLRIEPSGVEVQDVGIVTSLRNRRRPATPAAADVIQRTVSVEISGVAEARGVPLGTRKLGFSPQRPLASARKRAWLSSVAPAGLAKGAQPSWLRSLPTFCRITESRSPRGSSGGEERD